MEEKLTELIGVVQEMAPEVARQAVAAVMVEQIVTATCAAIIVAVLYGALAVVLRRKLIDRDGAGTITAIAMLVSVFPIAVFFIALTEIAKCVYCPDYMAVKILLGN